MTLTEFKEIIDTINTIDNRNEILYKSGLNVISFVDLYYQVIYKLGCEALGTEKWDFVEWYLYEAPLLKNETPKCVVNDKEYIINNVEDLYKVLIVLYGD